MRTPTQPQLREPVTIFSVATGKAVGWTDDPWAAGVLQGNGWIAL